MSIIFSEHSKGPCQSWSEEMSETSLCNDLFLSVTSGIIKMLVARGTLAISIQKDILEHSNLATGMALLNQQKLFFNVR